VLISYVRGQTGVVLRVKILDSSVATGAGLTGLTSASSGLIVSTIADNEATATAYTVAASNVETITTLGTYAAPTSGKCRFREVDATNHRGVYEIHLADARFAVSSAKSLLVSIRGATNAAETDVVIPLVDLNPYAATVNANVTQFGGSNGTFSGGRPEVNATHWGGTAVASATVQANVAQIAGQAAVAAASVTFPATVGSSTLDAAGVRTAVGLASANLDTQIAGVKGDTAAILLDTGTDGVVVASGSKTGYSLTAAGMDSVAVESGLNARQALSIIAASAAGTLNGAATTTVTIDGAGVATDRIVATVDADGNRTAVTLTPPA
jgi:hypothetical protein